MKKSINNDVIFNGTLQEILVPLGNWRRYETETIIRLYIELVERNYKPSISVKNSVYEFCQAEGVARIEEINNYELIKSRTIQDKTSFVREKKEIRKGELSSAGESLQFIALLQGATIFIMIIFYLIVLENPNALAGNYVLPFILAGVAIMSIISLHKAGDSLRKADKQNQSNKN